MTTSPIQNIRNFSIVAHIDHGKSTLADRLIQLTGGLEEREMKEQVLDSMDIERERGITIKAQTVRLNYKARDGKSYVLNLIDTPGHVDFAYEVNRSLAACEGSLLVVDASQGVEAQTLANVYQAIDNGHEIVPVLNKVDLPAAEPAKVKQQIEDVIGLDASNAIEISAKTGLNVPEVLEAIVTRLPPPKGDRDAPLKASLVDSWYDLYLGVVVLVRVVDGVLKKGQRIRMIGIDAAYEVDRVGVFTPKLAQVDELGPGEIGMLTASIKEVADTRVGDTITDERNPIDEPLPGFRPAIPVVFCGLFPVDAAHSRISRGHGPARLNDASFTYEMETSRRARFRLSLRLPRSVASRDHSGTVVARIQSRPVRDRTFGHLQDGAAQRQRARNSQSCRHAGPDANSGNAGALDRGDDFDAGRISRRGTQTLPGSPRRAKRAHLCGQPRDGEIRPSA